VLSGRGFCDELIARPEESYRLWRVVVCDHETSNEEAKARYGVVENTTKRVVTPRKQTNKLISLINSISFNNIQKSYKYINIYRVFQEK
jgi:hypothetical protein